MQSLVISVVDVHFFCVVQCSHLRTGVETVSFLFLKLTCTVGIAAGRRGDRNAACLPPAGGAARAASESQKPLQFAGASAQGSFPDDTATRHTTASCETKQERLSSWARTAISGLDVSHRTWHTIKAVRQIALVYGQVSPYSKQDCLITYQCREGGSKLHRSVVSSKEISPQYWRTCRGSNKLRQC